MVRFLFAEYRILYEKEKMLATVPAFYPFFHIAFWKLLTQGRV